MHFTQRLFQMFLRELLAFGLLFFPGGAGDGLFGVRGLLGLFGLFLVPQSSSHSLFCFLSTASILQETITQVRHARFRKHIKQVLNWNFVSDIKIKLVVYFSISCL